MTICDQCRAMYAKRPDQDPPCATCWVDLLPENRAAGEIFMVTQNQLITAGMGQPIDINILSIIESMKIYPETIEKPWRCLNKVRAAFHHFNNQKGDK